MSKVDWSLGPEGATHFLPALSQAHSDVWFKIVDGYAVSAGYERLNGWAYSYTKDCQPSTDMTRLISRKDDETKPWSGPEDGLPPVGLEVDFDYQGHPQGSGKVLFYGNEFCIVQNTSEGKPYEQVALIEDYSFQCLHKGGSVLDDRETAIREFMDVVGIDCRVTASKAVDAGFKREVV